MEEATPVPMEGFPLPGGLRTKNSFQHLDTIANLDEGEGLIVGLVNSCWIISIKTIAYGS
jgi:hypothetical protein